MAIPTPTFTPQGYVAPATSDILNGVQADLNAAFGGGMSMKPFTPQGQLAVSETAIVDDCYSTFILYTNLVDPAFTYGRFQDAIGRISFLTRTPAEPTFVSALCAGLAGTIIPVNSIAQVSDGSGTLYLSLEAATLDVTGVATVPFACLTSGPNVCAPGALSIIYKAIRGWDTITNLAAGVTGQDAETSAEFEARRQQSVAVNSINTNAAIEGAVLSVPGVIDAFVYDNNTSSSVTTGGQSIAAKSVYVCVAGGAVLDVATAIFLKKPPGCGMTGSTTQTVSDPAYVAYNINVPYTINFQIAAPTPVLFTISIAAGAAVPANAQKLIANAVVASFNGANNFIRARIGATIFAGDYYAPITALGNWVKIRSVLLGSVNATNAAFTASISGHTLNVSAVASGTLAVGQTVLDTSGSIAPGSIITSFGSGAGGAGSYILSIGGQSVASEAMVSVAPALNSTTLNINQVPTISSDNVQVVIS